MDSNDDLNRERRLDEMLREASAVPPAPDCRDAVMARIARRPRRWVYALVMSVVVICVAVGALVVLNQPDHPPVQQVVRTPKPQQPPTVKHEPPAQEAPAPRIEPAPKPEPEKPSVRREAPPRRIERPKHRQRIVEPAPKPELQAKEPDAAPAPVAEQPVEDTALAPETPPAPDPEGADPQRPVALVVVTWSSGETADDSYSYKDVDPATGETTTCSVTRSGDSVSLRLESTPGGDELPVKGCAEHEDTTSA